MAKQTKNGRVGRRVKHALLSGLATSLFATSATPEISRDDPTYNLYGTPGLIDMPTAEMRPDAEFAVTAAKIGSATRTTLTFQILPRLTGSFRYTGLGFISSPTDTFYDRSFDLRYQLLTETKYRPAVAIGLQDFIGTGIYSGEYIVATKQVAKGLKATAGLGWGRLGSFDPIGATGTRPGFVGGTQGQLTTDTWFRGDVAVFGGLSYAATDRLKFKIEYSSDDYDRETSGGDERKTSPWNVGLDYRFKNGTQLSLYHVLGTEVGGQLSLPLNPKTTGVPGGLETAGLPVAPRRPNAARDLGWTGDAVQQAQARKTLGALAQTDGLIVEAVKLEPRRATVRLVNPRYGQEPQAIGRLARAMTRSLPASIEEFVIVPMVSGTPMSAVVLQRSDIERNEHEAATEMLARTQIIDGYGLAPKADAGVYPQFKWSLAPYMALSVFDPEEPVRVDTGLRASATFNITPSLILSGSVRKKLSGNLADVATLRESALPRVRTDQAFYSREGDPAIEYLQLAHYGRLGKNLYSRATVGYLESMYGGASAEVLWKPVDSRLAFGAEVNYVVRRDFDQLFGFQGMTTTDPVTNIEREIPHLNGHLSAYYSFGNGFHAQLDAGRYLAGDYGATFALDREFANGWKIGAYATITDVSAEDFGEGSFDKGIRFTIPLAPLIGQPTRQANSVTVQSLSRDGGARLNVNGRLYNKVRNYHEPEVVNSWGRFWR